MRILVDIDNTIENLCEAWFAAVNKKYGTEVKAEEVKDWDVMPYFPTLTKEQVFGTVDEKDFWKDVRPFPGAVEGLQKLIADGHDVYLCTATYWSHIKEKYEDMIHKYFPFIPFEHIIICFNKPMIKADVLVDDGIHNLLGGEYVKLLYSQPHNENYDAEANGLIRVKNWDEVYSVISNLGVTE